MENELKPATLRRDLLLFLLLSCLCIVAMFRGAIWGGAILVPLDIPATIYSKFKWIDPDAGTVPKNHYLIDMFDYDVPRVYQAHQALQNGEFPWWDPYSHGGRPLLTEAHTATTDPIRLAMYRFLPFVTAYNWTRIIQSLFTGLGMFFLLRTLKFSSFTTILGALTFQFCGLQAVHFYPENVPNSLAYYPILWAIIHRFLKARPWLAVGLGGLCCAAIILAGNQQSQAYVVLILGCLILGYGSFSRADFGKTVLVGGGIFVLGCLLASPVLIPQVELFLLSNRELKPTRDLKICFTGILSLASCFPWVTGTFRSIDLGKLINQQGAVFSVFAGTPVMLMAFAALWKFRETKILSQGYSRAAALLVAVYFILICSTPALALLYTRSAGVGILGLIVLAGVGFDQLIRNNPQALQRGIRVFAVAITAVLLLVHLFAFVVYPKIKPRVLEYALKTDGASVSMPSSPDLRTFQVNNLPNEITFKNPEVVIAFAGVLLLLAFTRPGFRERRWMLPAIFACNIIPLLLFFSRFTPNSPIEHWERLLKGGPEQQRILAELQPSLRLKETTTGKLDYVFPGVTACYYNLHTLSGYSSFNLAKPGQTDGPRQGNLHAISDRISTAHGEKNPKMVRFIWSEKLDRTVQIVRETNNTITLNVARGTPGELVRTDTYYPGWQVAQGEGVSQSRSAAGYFSMEVPEAETEIVLEYKPSYSTLCRIASLCALALVLFLLGVDRVKRKQQPIHS